MLVASAAFFALRHNSTTAETLASFALRASKELHPPLIPSDVYAKRISEFVHFLTNSTTLRGLGLPFLAFVSKIYPQQDSQSWRTRERPEWDSNLSPARSKTGAAISSVTGSLV
uniref:Uncharacterized protein n=1 Tax=Anopheles culicifacies TaxID=139723 RepID=A0A182MFB5_9DIPT